MARPLLALRRRLEYTLLRLVTGVLRLIPLDRARRIGASIGGLGYAPFGVRRRVVVRQLAAAFPGLGSREVEDLARESYRNLGRMAIELALMSYLGPEGVRTLFEPDGDIAVLHRARGTGRGIVLFGGHVGNWEMAGAYIAASGIPVDVVARRMANPHLDGFLGRARRRVGMTVVDDHDAVRRVPRSIREGRAVGLVADQGLMGLASTYVPFFGRPARTPRGPAVFALRLRTPIVMCAAMLQPSGRYRFVAEEIPVSQTGNREVDVDTTVRAFTAALERLVRRYPDQYFWQHRRWKRQPPGTPAELLDPVR